MTMDTLLRSYFVFGIVLSVLGIGLRVLVRFNERLKLLLFQDLRKMARIVLLLGAVAAFIPFDSGKIGPIRSAQIWAGPSMKTFDLTHVKNAHVSFFKDNTMTEIPFEKTSMVLILLFAFGVCLFGFRLCYSFRQLLGVRNSSQRIRRFRRIEILSSEAINSPLSFVLFRRAFVLLPPYLLAKPELFPLALKHELEHLRRRDTRWAYANLAIESLYFWNPLAHLFTSTSENIQEFACDEALLGQKSFSLQAYGGCLLEVAKTMGSRSGLRVGTACSAVARAPSTLKRRIHYMMDSINNKKQTWYIWPVSALLLLGVVSTSVALQGTVQDRRITMERARELAVKAQTGTDFPITVNERVLKELNRYVGTPDGREYIRASFERMENYKVMIKAKLNDYRLPEELLAHPITESGYQNLPPSLKPYYSAGVWQFIPQTARNFGLIVGSGKDERLNVERETDAACRYLGSNFLRFHDWELAILSYNVGENAVQRGITKFGTRNAWELIDAGIELDSNYLAKVITSVIILKNPEIVN